MPASEVRARVSYAEMRDWSMYADEMGPLNLAVRIEWAVARAVAPFLKNVKPTELMAWPKAPDTPATPEEIMAALTNVARQNKKDSIVNGR